MGTIYLSFFEMNSLLYHNYNMLNIYILHKTPNHLNGYHDRDKLVPSLAYDIACSRDARYPEGEPAILKDPSIARRYAEHIIKGRWPEAEPIILTDMHQIYLYAQYVIRGRWEEAEPIIQTRANGSAWYATCILQRRWIEAEPIIRQNAYAWNQYCAKFLFILDSRDLPPLWTY